MTKSLRFIPKDEVLPPNPSYNWFDFFNHHLNFLMSKEDEAIKEWLEKGWDLYMEEVLQTLLDYKKETLNAFIDDLLSSLEPFEEFIASSTYITESDNFDWNASHLALMELIDELKNSKEQIAKTPRLWDLIRIEKSNKFNELIHNYKDAVGWGIKHQSLPNEAIAMFDTIAPKLDAFSSSFEQVEDLTATMWESMLEDENQLIGKRNYRFEIFFDENKDCSIRYKDAFNEDADEKTWKSWNGLIKEKQNAISQTITYAYAKNGIIDEMTYASLMNTINGDFILNRMVNPFHYTIISQLKGFQKENFDKNSSYLKEEEDYKIRLDKELKRVAELNRKAEERYNKKMAKKKK